jgi:hypothetical protein
MKNTEKKVEIKLTEKVNENLKIAFKKLEAANNQLNAANSYKNECEAEQSRLVETIIAMGSEIEDNGNNQVKVDFDKKIMTLEPTE